MFKKTPKEGRLGPKKPKAIPIRPMPTKEAPVIKSRLWITFIPDDAIYIGHLWDFSPFPRTYKNPLPAL
jgi:hypothetical protein